MNEQESKQRCEQLAAEHPDRETHRWTPMRRGNGEWSVAKIGLPPPVAPTGSTSHVTVRHPPDDPRENFPWLNPPSGGIA
jgi:hypothetical protein